MSDFLLRAEGLGIGYRDRRVIDDLTLDLPAGRVTALLGPNGCGKSTLLRTFARLIGPQAGRVTLGGTDVHAQDTRALARKLAILPQSPLAPGGITVRELVHRGRAPWRGFLSAWTTADEAACARALEAVGMGDLAERPLDELSGGQRQRAWIALALAQETGLLLLDEPTTWLDLPHQIEVLSLLRRRNQEIGTTVISVLHDLNLAARFSDHLVLMGPRGLVATGKPAEVVTPDHLLAAFGLSAMVMPDPVTGSPMVIPL
ncbi:MULTISPECIES: ABC transporter ATP-binding protein [unclassified Aureimonas]|uniref:ABC transporter ATP-binding protein n=1 Tax=unclassified Aureimonas TaxID=2615206 RepID=UPI0006F83A6E|nr:MULTISPECIES: ABC transporter ATP-binding protein [unclassified Aureimonas]KQT55238.1 iron dicitrate ABC transporter ATP-binding protein [Aureimonas sp. Leaf427]KQT71030.1 iron dicitrate ABC transporter ATP-binding protein [Aureimonas sp. Leaf460]